MEFETWSAINEAQKKDELFDCDKQDYEFEHVTINKKQKKNKKKFDLDNMNLDGDSQQDKQPPEVKPQTPQDGSAGAAPSSDTNDPNANTAPAQSAGGPCELPDEVLSDSEDEAEQPASLTKADYKTAAQEKPMDTFKSMYSEFKEFIPDSMKPKDERGKEGESRPRNVSFLNKAKGFFGL